ncbi:MAG: hypothetical protein K0U41_03005 [Gammaproteobacteria bacterium]|nr:hypothetical protein [Gammaproteobacteria bacterium]
MLPFYEEYLLRNVGIDPTVYYRDTIRNNFHRAKAWENEQVTRWEHTRHLSFMILDTTFAGMSGAKVNKKYKTPQSLFPLPNDPKSKEIIEEKDAMAFFKKQFA